MLSGKTRTCESLDSTESFPSGCDEPCSFRSGLFLHLKNVTSVLVSIEIRRLVQQQRTRRPTRNSHATTPRHLLPRQMSPEVTVVV